VCKLRPPATEYARTHTRALLSLFLECSFLETVLPPREGGEYLLRVAYEMILDRDLGLLGRRTRGRTGLEPIDHSSRVNGREGVKHRIYICRLGGRPFLDLTDTTIRSSVKTKRGLVRELEHLLVRRSVWTILAGRPIPGGCDHLVPILWRRDQYSYVFFLRRRLLSTPRIR
jgi:hypothetical protein